MMKKARWSLLFYGVFLSLPLWAICIENNTDFTLAYRIVNKNSGSNRPKIPLFEGIIAKEKKCFAHDHSDDDWKIYRYDDISIEKIESNGTKSLVCQKPVEGILNTLRIHYYAFNDRWFCLDRQDDED